MSVSHVGAARTRKSGRATIRAMIRSEWLMTATIANDSGSSTISSSPIVMMTTATQRCRPPPACVRSISGQVAITSVVAHTVAARTAARQGSRDHQADD